jgi:hypothetical protein
MGADDFPRTDNALAFTTLLAGPDMRLGPSPDLQPDLPHHFA